MEITIHNLGIIKEAKIDLKPLTIFVGPNNTGKTWAAHALGAIFAPSGFAAYKRAYIQGIIPDSYPSLDEEIEKIVANGVTTIDLLQFTADNLKAYFADVARFIANDMANVIGTSLVSFEDLNISIDMSATKTQILQQVLSASLQEEISGTNAQPKLTIRKARGDKDLFVYMSKESTSANNNVGIPTPIIRDFLFDHIFTLIHRSVYRHMRPFPTERTTYIAFPYLESERREEDASILNQFSRPVAEKKMSGLLGYFLGMMFTIADTAAGRRDARNKHTTELYSELAILLEKQILGGEVRFSQSREFLFQPANNRPMEISVASSMVKELAPLLLYLRYLARPGELIIIDEPEMNLHPEAQAKMIEFLALLTHFGLNILITTHSPYMIDHLINLIRASESENKDNLYDYFYLKRTDAFISRDKVSVYMFDGVNVKAAIDDEGDITLDTFGKISDELSDIYFKI